MQTYCSHISPNGFSFESKGMISLEDMKSVLEIDINNKTITVEGGITIQEIFDVLSKKGFSLPIVPHQHLLNK